MSEHVGESGLAALLSAINRAMARCGYVQKTGRNAFHGYSFASEADLLSSLRPALVAEGIVILPSLEGEPQLDEHGNTRLVMSFTVAHVSGAVWPDKLRFPGWGNDKAKNGSVGDKGAAKAMTMATKYALMKLMEIATGDDPEDDRGEPERERETPQQQDTKQADDLLAVLPDVDASLLHRWVSDVVERVPENQRQRCWVAYEARCKKLGIDPKQASRAPQNGNGRRSA